MYRISNFTLTLVVLFLLYHPDLIQAAPVLPDAVLDIPVTGNVQVPLSNGSMDTVPITGVFHVVSHASPDSAGISYQLAGALADVSGTGDYTGLLYGATSSWLEVFAPPQVPGKPLEIFGRTYLETTVSTMMYPPSLCPDAGRCVLPLNLYFTASFDPTGMMNAITINEVSIPSGE